MNRTHTGAQSPATRSASDPEERTAAIMELGSTRHPARIECLADELTQAGARHWSGSSRRALIEALVLCLAGDSIRQDADAEDAICSTLEQLGVMRRAGNLLFAFIPDDELSPSDLVAVQRYRAWLPTRYSAEATTTKG